MFCTYCYKHSRLKYLHTNLYFLLIPNRIRRTEMFVFALWCIHNTQVRHSFWLDCLIPCIRIRSYSFATSTVTLVLLLCSHIRTDTAIWNIQQVLCLDFYMALLLRLQSTNQTTYQSCSFSFLLSLSFNQKGQPHNCPLSLKRGSVIIRQVLLLLIKLLISYIVPPLIRVSASPVVLFTLYVLNALSPFFWSIRATP